MSDRPGAQTEPDPRHVRIVFAAMSSPISAHLDESRRRLRRAALIRGAAISIAAGVAGVAAAGAADGLVRSDRVIWRCVITFAAVAPAIWFAVRLVLSPLRERVSAVDLARRIEGRDPSWRGRLSAAAAFADGDERTGSPAIQAEVVGWVERELRSRPPSDLTDVSRVKRPVVLAVLAFALAVAVVVLAPSSAATALGRLSLPFSDRPWPRDVELQLLGPSGESLPRSVRIGRGQTLRFTVSNRRGDVPEELTLEVVSARGGRRSEPVPTGEGQPNDGPARRVGLGSIFAAEGPFRFRVIGGDDHGMAFFTAEVVPVPELEAVSLVLTPPAYLGKDAVRLPAGANRVVAVAGSLLAVTGRASKKLSAASLVTGDGAEIPAAIGADGRTVTAAFPLGAAGMYSCWLRLRDRLGVENPEPTRYEVRVEADTPPQVRLTDPAVDVRATAEAVLPVLIEADDDHGVTWAQLRFGRGLAAFDSESGTDDATQVIALSAPEGQAAGTYPLAWSLGPLGLGAGDRLSFRGEAGDAFDGVPGHVGFSTPRTVTVVSAAEKHEELLEREEELLMELRQARRDAGQVSLAVDELLTDVTQDGVGEDERDRVARTEAEQRRLSEGLVGPGQGLEAKALRAGLELTGNRLDDGAMAERLGRIVRELQDLREQALPGTNLALTEAMKAERADGVASSLAAAERHLEVVLGGLDSLLEDLGAWQTRRELDGEVADLLATQRDVAELTEQAASETLGAATGQLMDAQAANLERLGMRQGGVADRLERLESSIARQAAEPAAEGSNGAAPSEIADLAGFIGGAGLPATARAAGESIRANDLGEARRLQAEVSRRLTDLRDLLLRTGASPVEGEALRKEAEVLGRLAAAEGRIAETLRKAAESPEAGAAEARSSAGEEQELIREETLQAARRLRDVEAARPASIPLRAAERSMAEAIERLARGDDAGAAQAAEAAARQLEQSRDGAAKAAEEEAQRLARESAETTAGRIGALAERQGGVNAEVARLGAIKSEAGRLSRSQLRTLRQTADVQGELVTETESLADRLRPMPAVEIALRTAGARMARVAEALNAGEVGREPQRDGATAKEALDRVLVSLRPDRSASEGDAEAPPGREQAGPDGDGVSLLAQLELLKGMQEDLLRRTEALDAYKAAGAAAADEGESARLAAEQAALVEVFGRLVGGAQARERSE